MVLHSVTSTQKAQVEGLLLMRPGKRPSVPLALWSLRAGGCYAWIASQVHARSIGGTCQVHRAPYPEAAQPCR